MSAMGESKGRSINEGIQARDVRADVLAVGKGAKAVQHRGGDAKEALEGALAELRAALGELGADAEGEQEQIEIRLRALEEASRAEKPDKTEVEVALSKLAGVVERVEHSAQVGQRIVAAVRSVCSLVGASVRFFTA